LGMSLRIAGCEVRGALFDVRGSIVLPRPCTAQGGFGLTMRNLEKEIGRGREWGSLREVHFLSQTRIKEWGLKEGISLRETKQPLLTDGQ